MPDAPLVLDVFADIACPWCYVGEARLTAALRQRPDLDVQRRWRPFQLQPQLPQGGLPWRTFAEEKFGGWQRAQGMFAQVEQAAANDGITFAFDQIASAPNTADAHRLLLWAERQEVGTFALADAIFRAHFAEGVDINDHDALARIAATAGLDVDAARAFLATDNLADAVAQSQQIAQRAGISGVPLYLFGNSFALSGAQPAETFVRALDKFAEAEAAP